MLYERHIEAWDFTPRQRDVARELLHGRSPKQIGRRLDLNVQTIYWHVENMYHLTGVGSLGEFFAWANEHRDCCEIDRLWSTSDLS